MKYLIAFLLLLCLVSCKEDQTTNQTTKAIVLHQKSLTYLKEGKLDEAIRYSDSTLVITKNIPSAKPHDIFEVATVYGEYIKSIKGYISKYKNYTPLQLAALEERIKYINVNNADDVYNRGLIDKIYVNNIKALIAKTHGMKSARKEYQELKMLYGKV